VEWELSYNLLLSFWGRRVKEGKGKTTRGGGKKRIREQWTWVGMSNSVNLFPGEKKGGRTEGRGKKHSNGQG